MNAKEFPKKIYLQKEDGAHPDSDTYFGEGMTWCEDKVNNDDCEYIRVDVVQEMIENRCKEQKEICVEEIMDNSDFSEEQLSLIENCKLATDQTNQTP